MADPSTLFNRTLILVVEDEPAVRAVAVEALEDDGFEVIEAPSADHAAAILQARDDIAVVFTDVTMPGNLNGFDLARIAHRVHVMFVFVPSALGVGQVQPLREPASRTQ